MPIPPPFTPKACDEMKGHTEMKGQKGKKEMDTMLDLADQIVFLGERATGATNLLQCVWTYDRAIDMDGLHRFHHHLLQGRLSRHVERSPLPFGRHRWVSPNDAPAIEIARARPREEFGAWLREQTNTPLDYEHGPAWHLAVLPFTDGGTGLSLVISHGLTDGVGLTHWRSPTPPPAVTIRSAGRPPDHAAGGARCARTPGRLFATCPPSAGRSSPGRGWPGRPAGKPLHRRRRMRQSRLRTNTSTSRRRLSSSTWTSGMRGAKSLGGTSNSLLAGFAAKFAQRVGRVTAGDGSGHPGDARQRARRRRHPGQRGGATPT